MKRQFSEAHRRKLSERAKERMNNPEYKARQMKAKAETFAKPEVKERMSQSQKARFSNPANAEENAALQEKRRQAMNRPEVREKLSKSHKEIMANPENLEAMRARVKEAMNRPEVKAKVSANSKASHSKPEVKVNLSKAQKKRFENPEERKKTSEATKAVMPTIMQSEEYRANLAAAMSKVHRKKGPTDIEVVVETLLKALELEYETQKRIGGWVADFYVPSHNLIIECDGDYWHSSEKTRARDAKKDSYLSKLGYKVVRLLGSEIHAKKFDALLALLGLQNS